jgi:AraC family transcriptional regulator
MAAEILRRGEFIGDSFASAAAAGFLLKRWVCEGGPQRVEPHGHDEAHIMVITSGRFVTGAAGETPDHQLPLVYNPPQTFHRDHFISGPSSFFSISLDDARTRQIDGLRLPADPRQFSAPPVRALIGRLMREAGAWDGDSAPIGEALCLETLAAMSTARDCGRDAPAWLRSVAESCRESEIDQTVDALAALAGVHPVHLARTFRRFYRCTPGEFRRAAKIERAARMLGDPRKGLAEIAVAAGFVDQSHFSRLFKARFGMSPGRFRRLTR